ncbi:arginine deiminase [Williamsoniiplasma luminosum]|uniref:Arginine deiminase n=1 Tax=Williamsoniiplasma luminosum TaxID=214888 RepID=A0A2S0NKS6_9MOLU|nr:arginine deiminase [Williamsoniiplasma luminosum]AVP49618.1 MAG: arginine deiminase [Williamsoniiplasma luminosum]
MEKKVHVFSEIGKLKSVLVHRPGDEVENLTPEYLERLLFDDVPFKKVAIEEHNKFTSLIRENGAEVLYIEELVAETLDQNPKIKKAFVDQFINEASVRKDLVKPFKDFLMKMTNLDMAVKMIAGTKKLELGITNDTDKYPFIADPLPNVLFQRDPFASIGNGVTMHHMWSVTRNRETIFPDLVFKNHKRFAGNVPYFYERNWKDFIEGGDILVLNSETLIIGVSQRTSMAAIEKASKKIFKEGSYNKILVLDLPKSRAFMHLDTVFTNVDYDKFIVHPLIFDSIDQFKIFELSKDGKKEIKKPLVDVLSDATGYKVQLIKCGGEDPIAAGREQWNDGTNVLTIAPGVVIAYERNWVTIDLLEKAGVKVIKTPSSELSRGRGGPRCMTMPIIREDLPKKTS